MPEQETPEKVAILNEWKQVEAELAELHAKASVMADALYHIVSMLRSEPEKLIFLGDDTPSRFQGAPILTPAPGADVKALCELRDRIRTLRDRQTVLKTRLASSHSLDSQADVAPPKDFGGTGMKVTGVFPDIVPDDCFLRKLPTGLILEQRMQLDALRVAAEMVGLANFRLMNLALHICREEVLKPSRTSMSALLLDAWSIVSHCHTIREILTALKFTTPEIAVFLAATEQVSEVRDAQQHYQDQFPNRSKKKRKTAPLYGAVAWTYVKDPPPLTGLYLCTCWSGATLEPKLSVNIPNPAGKMVRIPVGALHLQAFDYDIDLQKVTNDVSSLVQHLNSRVADIIREEIDKLAAEKQIEKEKLHANPAADLFLALWVEVKAPESGGQPGR